MTTMQSLPDALLEKIFLYVKDPQDLLSCERTCRNFHRVLSSDDVWIGCSPDGSGDPRLTHRTNAFVNYTIKKIHYHQRRIEPISVIDVFHGTEPFRDYVQRAFQACTRNDSITSTHQFRYVLRGDSLGIMVEILEDYFVERIEEVSAIVCHFRGNEPNEYPTIKREDLDFMALKLCERSTYSFGDHDGTYWKPPQMTALQGVPLLSLLDESLRTKLVRRFAYIAGAVKLTDDAFDCLGLEFLRLTCLLIRVAMEEHRDCVAASHERGCSEGQEVDLNNVAPPNKLFKDHNNNGSGETIEFVIVPRQILNAAQLIKGYKMKKIYGCTWIAKPGNTIKEEVQLAKSQYYTSDMTLTHLARNFPADAEEFETESDDSAEIFPFLEDESSVEYDSEYNPDELEDSVHEDDEDAFDSDVSEVVLGDDDLDDDLDSFHSAVSTLSTK